MIWTYFAATVPVQLAVIESTMNSSVYQNFFFLHKSNVRPFAWQLKIGCKWVCEYVIDDPKHSGKSTTECLKKKIIKVWQWSSQSPDLNLTEMWWDLKRAVYKQMLQTSIQNNVRLLMSHRERFLQVFAAKHVSTRYSIMKSTLVFTLSFSAFWFYFCWINNDTVCCGSSEVEVRWFIWGCI